MSAITIKWYNVPKYPLIWLTIQLDLVGWTTIWIIVEIQGLSLYWHWPVKETDTVWFHDIITTFPSLLPYYLPPSSVSLDAPAALSYNTSAHRKISLITTPSHDTHEIFHLSHSFMTRSMQTWLALHPTVMITHRVCQGGIFPTQRQDRILAKRQGNHKRIKSGLRSTYPLPMTWIWPNLAAFQPSHPGSGSAGFGLLRYG